MKTKTILGAFAFTAITIALSNCGSADKPNTQETILNEVPTELKDTSVINNDEENALDKLNAVIDSSTKSE